MDYGPDYGDSVLPRADDRIFLVNLSFNIYYSNEFHTEVYISTNGFITFEYSNDIQPRCENCIKIYNFDLNTDRGGDIFYRTIDNETEIDEIQEKIGAQLFNNFKPKKAFLITWAEIKTYSRRWNGNSTFQLVLLSNESEESAFCLIYEQLTFPINSKEEVYIGFYQYECKLENPWSSKTDVVQIANDSNIENLGVWLYFLTNISKVAW